jgi:hypothetical protein
MWIVLFTIGVIGLLISACYGLYVMREAKRVTPTDWETLAHIEEPWKTEHELREELVARGFDLRPAELRKTLSRLQAKSKIELDTSDVDATRCRLAPETDET